MYSDLRKNLEAIATILEPGGGSIFGTSIFIASYITIYQASVAGELLFVLTVIKVKINGVSE